MELNLQPWLKLMASHDPTPAGGSLAMVTLAAGAALTSKCARLSGVSHQSFDDYACEFERFAVEDCEAYAALTSGDAARADAAQSASLRHLQRGLEFLEEACELKGRCKPVLAPDLKAARGLAAASLRVLLVNLEINASLVPQSAQPAHSAPQNDSAEGAGSASLAQYHMQLSRLGL